MKKPTSTKLMQSMAATLAIMSLATGAKATPFASCVTNTAGTISFYLNEPGANVTITYEDGSTNASFNGVTSGTNLTSGVKSFSLTGHTTYAISVAKTGSGTPSLISSSPSISNTRGVDANKIPTSTAFGRIYDVQANTGLFLFNSDLTYAKTGVQNAGVFPKSTASTTLSSPAWVSVAPDGSVIVSDESVIGAGVYICPPDVSSAQLLLGPIGATNSVHGPIIARAILNGSISNGNATLFTVDGDFGNPGSIQYYNIGAGPLPWTTPPTYQGAQVAIAGGTYTAEYLGGNEYAGLTQGPNGYIYASTYRGSPGSAPYITITDATGTNIVWLSTTNSPPTGDWFYQPSGTVTPGTGLAGTSAVSPDGKYLVGVSIDNYFVIAPLTNGIPNTSAIFVVAPTSYSGNGRGVCWDAADNIILSSSGIGLLQQWSLGTSGTAVTTGNASGTTGFTLTQPSTTVSVVATTPVASQGGVNGTVGTPVPGVFTLSRYSTNGYASALTVNYVLTGTALPGATNAYTVASTNSVTFPAGQTNVTVTINPTTNNIPRPTTTVILSIAGGAGYSATAPFTDTIKIQNTSSQLLVASVGAPSAYKAFSNDYASLIITRYGDTNAAAYTASSFTTTGTAVIGTDFTAPTSVTFNPGDLTQKSFLYPLVGGLPPVDNTNSVYTGNKVANVSLVAGTGYGVSNTVVALTLIDNRNPTTTVLFSDPLTDPNDASNYNLTFANTDGANTALLADYDVAFGYDLTDSGNQANFGVVGLPPNGNTKVLRMTVNKDVTPGAAAGVNVYPTNVSFSGNFAVRFYMNLVQGSSLSTATEGALFGINHNGQETNWWTGSSFTSYGAYTNWASDGIWYWLSSDAGGAANGDYIGYLGGTNAPPSPSNTGWIYNFNGLFYSSFLNQFKTNVFTTASSAGLPANESSFTSLSGAPASSWADVEIKQINGVVTWAIDKTVINTYTNKTVYTNGTVMLGYNDPFSSVGSVDGAVYFSGLRVVQVGAPVITGISIVPGSPTNVVINFTTTDGDDTISSFNLLGSNPTNSVANLVDTATTATFTQLGSGAFQAVTAMPTNKVKFYRIQHK